MNYIYAIIAGIIQGLTEFLPVSSSGHLVLFHDLLGFNLPDNLVFDVVLHLGTLGALFLYFYKDIFKYLKGFFDSLQKWNLKNDVNQRLAWMLLAGTMPAVFAGYFLEDIIETIFRDTILIAIMLIIFGVILFAVDKYSKKEKELDKMTWLNAMAVGLAQVLALVPGVSRSGITIIAGLGQKLKREAAARFSFLLSMPIVLGAGVKKILDIEDFSYDNAVILILGFLSALLVGYMTVKYFLSFLQKNSLKVFVWYRILLGVFIIIFIFWL